MRYKGREVAPSGQEQHIIALTSDELSVIRNLLIGSKKYLPRNFDTLRTFNIVENIINGMRVVGHFEFNKYLYYLPEVNRTNEDAERHYSRRSFYSRRIRPICERCGSKYRVQNGHERRCRVPYEQQAR